MNAFGYLRVSGKGQLLDDADGFPRQREYIERYAAANGIEIVRWFEERGVCGATDWEERPAWVDMMVCLGDVQTVVIERLDRLARDMGVQEHIMRDLKKRRITLISTVEPDLDSDLPTRVLVRQMLGSIAQYERANIEIKLRHARERQRAKNGRCEGRKPFGHRPDEGWALRGIVDMKKEGYTTRRIAQVLNDRNVPTRSGKPWSHGTVAKILSVIRRAPVKNAIPQATAGDFPSSECVPESR